ncbi:DUF2059 domain-containing protein [Flexibacterium corallicola]|uniref:DUF2059 domain-containing protein n=1 Tax=Flexibacterium corallicola TaxID=3037259 RepID=UPI00286EC364|nr:DUF2059 domain-containing protein [Pseudovibrio sp. M1P-2-3]
MLARMKTLLGTSVAAAMLAGAVMVSPVTAQETIAPSHLQAAKTAIKATKSTDGFDNILPDIAERTRTLFIRNNPSLGVEIDTVVTDVAMQLVSRRAELDKVIAEVWARRFSEEELSQITAFYRTEAGSKLADLTKELSALSIGAAKQWSDAISTEMVTLARKEISVKANQ